MRISSASADILGEWGKKPCAVRRRNAINKKMAGFTLIEVMISVMLVVVAIGGLWSAFLSGMMLVEQGRNTTHAAADARTLFEEMRRRSDTSLGAITGLNWTAWAQGAGLTGLPGESILVIFTNPASNPVQATATVSWTEKNRNRSASFTGLVTVR